MLCGALMHDLGLTERFMATSDLSRRLRLSVPCKTDYKEKKPKRFGMRLHYTSIGIASRSA